jgi:GNAT superfamily N-acetyltransferase
MAVIRPITEADTDAVATVHVRTWQVGYAGIVPDEHLARLDPVTNAARRRNQPARPDQHTLVADEDGRIAGFVSFGPYRREDQSLDAAIGELYAIYVAPEAWGRGIGRLLLDACRKGLAADGFPGMRLWVLAENVRARRFYERMGLAPDGATQYYTPRGIEARLPELRYASAL